MMVRLLLLMMRLKIRRLRMRERVVVVVMIKRRELDGRLSTVHRVVLLNFGHVVVIGDSLVGMKSRWVMIV